MSTRQRIALDPTPSADELCPRDWRTRNSDVRPLEAAGRDGRSYDLIHHAELADAEQCDAIPGGDDWLDGIEDAGLPPLPREHLDPLADLDAPLVATWWAEHLCAATVAKLSGAHVSTWQYHEGIEAEVWRLAAVCRNSSGIERESTLRQLHHAQSDLDAFRRTPEFQSALRYMLTQVDAAIVAPSEALTSGRIQARQRYISVKAELASLMGGQGANQPDNVPVEQVFDGTHVPVGPGGSVHAVQQLEVADANPESAQIDDDDAGLAALFDPVKAATLEKMFPDAGRWATYAERAGRNGLKAAREERGRFNPFRAAAWWIDVVGPAGWDWARCLRVLANNLPPRSRDSNYLLTGELD